eukprot:CAMPEP_0116032796 /NCGR_PEP_ID=MMETSP0321-20121206/18429_1 /TAXON_ID=163516 /ORGANISM="Leptocylindrus danicus var. danicus, Strain B650" /LENGTH=52 /DNA_ID=CAMNT_0003508393 /DNA_START=267 /DNA_END=422 /DNA_ORIENTATION=-
MPSELGLLTDMQTLWLHYNSLTYIPDEVCALRDVNGGNLNNLLADCEEVECA